MLLSFLSRVMLNRINGLAATRARRNQAAGAGSDEPPPPPDRVPAMTRGVVTRAATSDTVRTVIRITAAADLPKTADGRTLTHDHGGVIEPEPPLDVRLVIN